ncbi:hypothetical protein F6B41_03975 [Microbacterium lushaniae]|nr:hypothetical protein F6B41_25205 [Microbacterium lushaniae]KAA9158157.1 hypothetical protein F6B41_03975 [Microbacterium lushaniae]
MSTLTDRYVDAAMRSVPEKQRADLAAELRASIGDQIDARLDSGAAPLQAERAVLTELGDPDRLAAAYIDRPLWLVGPRYYLTWWRLTRLLWAIVPVCAAFGVALGQTLAGAPIGQIVGTTWGTTVSVIVHIGFWTTLVFFIVERAGGGGKDAGLVTEWTPDDLPEPKAAGTTLADLVASLILIGVAIGAVVWDHLLGAAYVADQGWIPFLSPRLWPWWTAGLFVLLAGQAALTVYAYARGRWTMGPVLVKLVLNVVIAVAGIGLLRRGELLNPGFWTALIPADSADTVASIIGTLCAFGLVALTAGDTIDAFVKARRSR